MGRSFELHVIASPIGRSNLQIGEGIASSPALRLRLRLRSARWRHELRVQMFREEIGDGIIASDTVLIFEHVVPFIFKDEQLHIFVLLP